MKVRKKAAGLCYALLAVVLTALGVMRFYPDSVAAAPAGLSDATTQKLEAQIAAITKKQKEYLNEISVSRSKKSSAIEQKTTYDSYITTTQIKIDLTNDLITELTAQIETKTQDIAAKEIQIEEQRALCLKRLRASYEGSTTGYLETLLDAESLSEFLTHVENLSDILDYDRKMLAQYETDKADLIAAKEALTATADMKESALATLEEDKASYDEKLKETEADIKALESDEAAQLKAYYEAKEMEDKLDKELTAYLVELQEKLNKQYVGGELAWPMDLSINYITSYFGPRKLNGVYDNHGGIDIWSSTIYGKSIKAANAGTVVVATYHFSYGNYVIIDHGGGKSTLYAHASKLCVSVGDEVTLGQKIAEVGSTGNSTGAHLHFEVRINGVRDNPLNYVNQPK